MPTLPHGKGSTRGFTAILKAVAQDESLSFDARGLYVLFASYPARLFGFRELCDSSPDGDTAVMDALVELIEADLVERRDNGYMVVSGDAR